MVDYSTAEKLYLEIKEVAAKQDEEFQDFYNKYLKNAVEYANTRSKWFFMDNQSRNAEDAGRTALHNAFISSLNAVCRFLQIPNIDTILPDRKAIGDFACYIALFLALDQR